MYFPRPSPSAPITENIRCSPADTHTRQSQSKRLNAPLHLLTSFWEKQNKNLLLAILIHRFNNQLQVMNEEL
jgi:hypothetical protein